MKDYFMVEISEESTSSSTTTTTSTTTTIPFFDPEQWITKTLFNEKMNKEYVKVKLVYCWIFDNIWNTYLSSIKVA